MSSYKEKISNEEIFGELILGGKRTIQWRIRKRKKREKKKEERKSKKKRGKRKEKVSKSQKGILGGKTEHFLVLHTRK